MTTGRRSAVLALDVGTSSTRALLFDQTANVLPGAEVHRPYERTLRTDGTAEVQVETLFAAIVDSVDELLHGAAADYAIVAVGISTFWHGLLAVSRDGSPLTPLYLWSDSRSWKAAESLRAELDAEAVRQRTGCAIHPSYWPAKLSWLRTEQPQLWGSRPLWLSIGDLLCWRWFGDPVTSLSVGSGTGLLRLREPAWDDQLLRVLELDRDSLPEVAAGSRRLVNGFASRWPALGRVPWHIPMGDGALASLGSGCVEPRARSLTIGTSAALRVADRGVPDLLPPGLFCYRLDNETVVAGAASSNGGNLHEWLGKTLQLGDDAERAIAEIEPGSHGLVFLPLLAGERSLGYSSHATGAVAGLTLATTPVQVARAGMEAIAIELARYGRRIDEAWPAAERIVGSGAGLLKSAAWMQIIADAAGRPLHAGAGAEASSRGAAILALREASLWDDRYLQPETNRVFEPDPTAHAIYARAAGRQEELYDLLVRKHPPGAPTPSAHLVHGS